MKKSIYLFVAIMLLVASYLGYSTQDDTTQTEKTSTRIANDNFPTKITEEPKQSVGTKKKAKPFSSSLPTIASDAIVYTSNNEIQYEGVETRRERKERKRTNAIARNKAEFEMLKNPLTGKIPREDVIRSKEMAKLVPELALSPVLNPDGTETLPTITVETRGPNNYGGRTRALGFDVRNTQIMLSGGVSGGIYRSTNGGTTWTRVTPLGEMHNVTAIAQDTRSGHEDTWYCGTGEKNGNSASGTGASYFGHGIWKSTDNGVTWTVLASTRNNQFNFDSDFDYISRIVVSPNDGSVIVAASETIQRSTDGGTTWTTVLGTGNQGGMGDVIYNAASTTFYAAIYGSDTNGGVHKSTNNGATWTQIATGTALHSGGVERIVLSNVANTASILAFYQTNDVIASEGAGEDLVQSKVGLKKYDGTNWTADYTSNISLSSSITTKPKNIDTQSGYNMCITTKPDDANIIYLGGVEVFRLNTSDNEYKFIGGTQMSADATNLHVDNHLLMFEPNSNTTLWAANDGGLRKTDVTGTITAPSNPVNGPNNHYLGGFDWADRNANYTTHQYFGADINPTNGSTFVAGAAQDNAFTIHPTDGTAKEVGPSADGTAVGIITGTNMTTYKIIVGWQNGGLGRLDNGTLTSIQPTNQAQDFHAIMLLDADNTNHLYYPTNAKKLFRTRNAASIEDGTISSDASTNWEEITGVGTTLTDYITTIEVSRNNAYSNAAYTASNANRKMYIGTKNGKVYRLADPAFCAVASTPIDITPVGATGYVSDVAVNPYDDKEILVTYSNYGVKSVWHTTDASVATPTWNDVEGAAGSAVELSSARSAMIVKVNAQNLYVVGTSTGLYATTSLSGNTTAWEKISTTDIGQSVCVAMRLRPSDNKMVLGTHGNGLYMLNFPETVLPIDLVSFNAKKENNKAKIEWQVNSIQEGNTFIIEKSNTGNDFEALGKVSAQKNQKDYNKYDDTPSVGANYYRLKMIDNVNSVTYSKVKTVFFENSATLNVYPNPVKGNNINIDLNVNNNMNCEIECVDITGRTIISNKKSLNIGKNTIQMDITELQAGIYIIKIKDNNKVINTTKIIKE